MKFKSLFLTSAMLLSSTTANEHLYTNNTKETLTKALSEVNIEHTGNTVFYKFNLSKELLTVLDDMDFESPSETVFSRELHDLKNSPLFMK